MWRFKGGKIIISEGKKKVKVLWNMSRQPQSKGGFQLKWLWPEFWHKWSTFLTILPLRKVPRNYGQTTPTPKITIQTSSASPQESPSSVVNSTCLSLSKSGFPLLRSQIGLGKPGNSEETWKEKGLFKASERRTLLLWECPKWPL